MNLKMLISPISLTRKANILKIGGGLGGAAVATVVLEFAAQAITKFSSQAATIGDNPVPAIPAVPFVGDVTLKDAPSLMPAVAGIMAVLKGRTKVGAMMIVGSIGAKSALRAAGYNPDEMYNKAHGWYERNILKLTKKEDDEYYTPEVYF